MSDSKYDIPGVSYSPETGYTKQIGNAQMMRHYGPPIRRNQELARQAGADQIAVNSVANEHLQTSSVATGNLQANSVTSNTVVNKNETASITTTSTSYVEIVDLTSTISCPVDCNLLILFRSNVNNNTSGFSTDTQLNVDGANYYESRFTSSTANTTGNNSNQLLISATAGSHTVKVYWKATAGTSTMHTRQLIVLQIKR